MIEVIPARAVIDMERCVRGWCEAAYAGQVGYVYTPVLVSARPVAPTDEGPMGVLTRAGHRADRRDQRGSRRRSRVPRPGHGPVIAQRLPSA